MSAARTILGLDLGAVSGFSILSSGTPIVGEWNCQADRFETTAMTLVRFRSKLIEVLDSLPIELVVYELVPRPLTIAGGATPVLGFRMNAQLAGHLVEVCESRGVPCATVTIGQLKKYATGKGNSKKEVLQRLAKEELGREVTGNEADAYFASKWMRDHYAIGALDL